MNSDWALVIVGLFLLAGFAAHVLGQKAHIPRVTLLLLFGVGVGATDLLPEQVVDWFPLATQVALSLVGFVLGERFFGRRMRERTKVVVSVALAETLGAAICVFGALMLTGTSLVMSLLFAGLAPASAPAATVDVIRESGARGRLTDTVLGVVAIDDAYGIILFSFLLVIAEALSGSGISWSVLLHGGREVFGAGLLGLVLGIPMAAVTGRAKPGELTLLEALGFVLLCGGLASVLEVSFLLACMTLGAVVARRAHHHTRPLHAIEGISQPFLVTFFLLAGFEFDLSDFLTFGLVGAAYVIARSLGLIVGGTLGARAVGASPVVTRYVGWCLLPQAGVALGLGLIAAQRFPEVGEGLLSMLVGTTFAFEVLGPIATRIALRRSGETAASRSDSTA